MSAVNENEIVEAYWLWLRAYQVETRAMNAGALESARRALLLTLSHVAQASNWTAQALRKVEQNEDQGSAKLSAVKRAAEAMGCDFIYFVAPKNHQDFSQVIWQKILPVALEDVRVRSARPERRARILAATAKDLMMSPQFRREMNWTPRKN